ncbi:MAG: ribose 5-phosphate isomerase B [Dehalococcoidia bacterium]|nr:ribose 5-phosphate isomerase B [Dehalococcoidia bacterium]
MRIAIGSDHAGFEMKEALKGVLAEMDQSHEDFGCYDTASTDYPDIGFAVASAVAQGRFDRGILICGSGIGMSIVANKVSGIRAALCHDTFSARVAREHNDANVLCMGQRVIGEGLAREIVITYLNSEFLGGRHARRLEKVNTYLK